MSTDPILYGQAVRDFRRARQKADLQELIARLRGQKLDLLAFEEVRSRLRATGELPRGLQEISLDAIVGSVGRYLDFTRDFLPRQRASESRWARVKSMMEGLTGLPPIEVYQVGDVYFVKDGHHRVSVARDMGSDRIEAYVTEITTKVPIDPEVSPEDLIIKSEQVDFLERTKLDEIRPGNAIEVTEPGKFETLLEHIRVHRYYMGQEQERQIDLSEAAAHWYDLVYRPVVETIHRQGILKDFPGRTEADLYIWLSDHRVELEQALGWEVDPAQAADDLASAFSQEPGRIADRFGDRLRSALLPAELESGPSPGDWRRTRLEPRAEDRLFQEILVPLSGQPGSWEALEQAVEVAVRERGRVLGLHIHGRAKSGHNAAAVEERFLERCNEAGLPARFVAEGGKVADRITLRSRWADLVVMKLDHPPAPTGSGKLSSGLRTLIRQAPRPLLLVPQKCHPVQRALLAFDGSAKSFEALFVATYLVGAWGVELHVVSVEEEAVAADQALAQAQEYLASNGVGAALYEATGPVSTAVLDRSEKVQADLILMGGYGASPVIEVVLGSAVDHVLRKSELPILVCR